MIILIALWAALYLPGLGEPELRGEEGRRILPAREMLRRGEYVVPYSEGRPYHRKPPGINWSIAAFFKLTGEQNGWTARLPSVLGLLGLAVVGWWTGKAFGGPSMAWAMATALLINVGMAEKARLIEIEALYVSLAGMGMLLWMGSWVGGVSVVRLWLVTVIPFALANLVKGPVYLLFFYAFVLVALKRSGRLRDLRHPAHWLSLALALAPMIWWGYVVQQRMLEMPALPPVVDEDGNSISLRSPGDVWWQQIAGRLTFQNINAGDWAQLPFREVLMFCPWPLLAGWLAWKHRSQPRRCDRVSILRSALGWGSLVSCALFCLLPSTRARYLMAALAPVCAWSVLTIFAWWSGRERARPLLLALVSLAALSVPWWLPLESPVRVVAWNACGVLISWIAWNGLRLVSQPLRLFVQLLPPMLLLVLLLVTTIQPVLNLHENVRPTAEKILLHTTTQPGSIAAISPGPQPFLFYLGKRCVEVAKISELPPDTSYLLISPQSWADDDFRTRLAGRGFTELLTSVTDQRFDPGQGREYLLIGKVL